MKKITRSQDERIIAGVCGGFAKYFDIDVTIVRLIWIFITIFGGIGILAYIFSLVLIPESDPNEVKDVSEEDTSDEKMVIWGVIIVAVGILLFFRHKPIFGVIWHTFTVNWLNIIFAVVLIGFGAGLTWAAAAIHWEPVPPEDAPILVEDWPLPERFRLPSMKQVRNAIWNVRVSARARLQDAQIAAMAPVYRLRKWLR